MNTIYISWQMHKESKTAHRNIAETLISKDIEATVEYLCEFDGQKWAKVISTRQKSTIINALAVNQARELSSTDDEMLRSHINNMYNSKRNAEMEGTFEWNGSVFDGDERSYTLICSAVDLGISQEWTLADNSKIPVTIDDLEAIKLARITTGGGIYQSYRTLKESLATANRDDLITIISGI